MMKLKMSPYESDVHVIINVIWLLKTHELKTRSSPSLQSGTQKLQFYGVRKIAIAEKKRKKKHSLAQAGRGRFPSLHLSSLRAPTPKYAQHVYGVNQCVLCVYF